MRSAVQTIKEKVQVGSARNKVTAREVPPGAGRGESDAGAHFALSFSAVRRLWTVREVPPRFAGHVVFGVKVAAVFDGPESPVT